MKRLVLAIFLLSACGPKWAKDAQKKDQFYFSLCPPGLACLGERFAVNRLNHPIAVKYNEKLKRFARANDHDRSAIILLPGGVVDFALQPDYVVATPGPHPGGMRQ